MSSGRLLARVSVLPALVVSAWLLAALPLLLAGWFRPIPALLTLPVVAGVALVGWRALDGSPLAAGGRDDVPWWTTGGIIAVGVGSALVNGVLHSEQLILRRDAASYAQIGHWLAGHGRLPIPVQLEAFGGIHDGLAVGSGAFYADGGSAIPQFMSGLPMTLAGAEWLAGWRGALWLPAVFGGLAMLAFGGLAARLVGARWAVPATLVIAVALPIWHSSRSTLSEPLALLLLMAGFCLLADAIEVGAARDRRSAVTPVAGIAGSWRHADPPVLAALLGGLLIGSCTLVRVDALRELTLLVPVLGWLWLKRRRLIRPLGAGLLIGLAFGVVDGWVLSKPYIIETSGSLLPLAALLLVLIVGTVAAVVLIRRRSWTPSPRLGWIAAAATVVAGVLFAIRPLLQTAHGSGPHSSVTGFVADLQRQLGLPVDGTRSYAEFSLHWVAWWLGWPAVVLGIAGAAILVRRVLAGRDEAWIPVLAVGLGTVALTLWRPGITPDHPWADRRLVPVVLPVLVLFATFAVAALTRQRWLGSRVSPVGGPGRALVGAVGMAAILVPTVLAAQPLLGERTELGSIAAIEGLCASLRPGDAVLLIDNRARTEWGPSIRGECGLPAVGVRLPTDPTTLAGLTERIRASGRTPVLLAAETPQLLIDSGFTPEPVVDMVIDVDQRTLVSRPNRTVPEPFEVWMARP
jgi:hypothetical protein